MNQAIQLSRHEAMVFGLDAPCGSTRRFRPRWWSIASVDDPAYLADKLVNHFGIKFPER